jgi:hypothetical protein
MKKELKKFIENETGFKAKAVNTAINKYFIGKEVEWDNKYVHEIDTMFGENGEVTIKGSFGTIVFNADNLFLWLPVIVSKTKEQRDYQTEMINDILRAE